MVKELNTILLFQSYINPYVDYQGFAYFFNHAFYILRAIRVSSFSRALIITDCPSIFEKSTPLCLI